jgi:hypothetical protein
MTDEVIQCIKFTLADGQQVVGHVDGSLVCELISGAGDHRLELAGPETDDRWIPIGCATGPAIQLEDGREFFYLDGKPTTKEALGLVVQKEGWKIPLLALGISGLLGLWGRKTKAKVAKRQISQEVEIKK